MAGKLGSHLGHNNKPLDEAQSISSHSNPPSPSVATQYITHGALPQYEHRGSIATDRTSLSDWSKRGDSMDVQLDAREAAQRIPQRVKGNYRLSDFIIERTLGTGSFGRVHLGSYYLPVAATFVFANRVMAIFQYEVNITFGSMLSRS